jgi:hypothetical protein
MHTEALPPTATSAKVMIAFPLVMATSLPSGMLGAHQAGAQGWE